MPNSINSLSPDFRDFLLNRNLITDTVTENGLEGLLVGIGEPITNIGTPPEAVQPSESIIEDGGFYKDLNLLTNKFQATNDDYRLADITYKSNNPPSSAYIYSVNYTDDSGVLNDTLNTPSSSNYQGGDIRQYNTSKNLYDDPSKRLTINLTDVSLPNVKYTNYQDLNASIVSAEIDILGTILTGGQVGLGTGGAIEPNFDLRSSLVGRVLGGTGIISDTPIGQAGAKYLGLALANNAAFGLQQETLGNINLNPLNIAKNGLDGIIVPNYDITVPSGKLGKVLDFAARVLGFESPISLFQRSSSIFSSENPIGNIERANAQISNTGKGQVLSLFANIKSNKFKPGFQDSRVKGEGSDGAEAKKGDGINPNLYAFGTSDGGVIDFLNNVEYIDFNEDEGQTRNEFDPNTPISQSNYRLEQMVKNSGFDGVENGVQSPLDMIATGNDGPTKYSWGDNKDNKDAQQTFNPNSFTSPNSILTKTQNLFNSGRMKTLASGQYGTGNFKSETQSAVRQGGLMSKGSGVLTSAANAGNFEDTDNVFCRTWSTFDRYDQVQDLQKSSGIDGSSPYREGYVLGDSVLGENGFVKIGPYIGDDISSGGDGDNNIKNFMFSLENLAWSDDLSKLIPCEKGPGDPMGKRGRIMWFPPYDLSVTENVSVNWESTNFIGRGEPVYTYNNTERTGTLQFKVVVDHPTYLNALKGNDGQSDDYIASFFAGCTDIDPELSKKLTTTERDELETRAAPEIPPKVIEPYTPDIPKVDFYFRNDNFEIAYEYENGDGSGLGTTPQSLIDGRPVVSSTIFATPDNTDFGLNSANGTSSQALLDVGNWITPTGQGNLKKLLNVDCPACKIKITGYASKQGLNSSKNQTLSNERAKHIKNFFINQKIIDIDLSIYGNTFKIEDKIVFSEGKGETGGGSCPTEYIKDENGRNTKKRVQNQDIIGCKESRKVTVAIVWDAENELKLQKLEPDPIEPPPEKWRVSQRIINRFYNECNYFEKLKQEDNFIYSSLKEKLKFFHPAFHAITPEGLNSRLTFLQQCTRQGPTSINDTPDNLAFGRPPVCILRLGDFYHSKIIIDNIGISYEPLVWDLNPEGIGVQPMIATVDLSYKMIGGQSMKGPINKLQNAVSFNFFGNTQIYDVRADKLVKDRDSKTGENEYKIIPGETVAEPFIEKIGETLVSGGNGETSETDQVGALENANSKQEQIDDNEVISKIILNSVTSVGTFPLSRYSLNFTFKGKSLFVSSGQALVGYVYLTNIVLGAEPIQIYMGRILIDSKTTGNPNADTGFRVNDGAGGEPKDYDKTAKAFYWNFNLSTNTSRNLSLKEKAEYISSNAQIFLKVEWNLSPTSAENRNNIVFKK